MNIPDVTEVNNHFLVRPRGKAWFSRYRKEEDPNPMRIEAKGRKIISWSKTRGRRCMIGSGRRRLLLGKDKEGSHHSTSLECVSALRA